MSLNGVAKETLNILEEGFYISPSGQQVKIDEEHKAAVNGTILYTPMEAISLLKKENICLPGQTSFWFRGKELRRRHNILCHPKFAFGGMGLRGIWK